MYLSRSVFKSRKNLRLIHTLVITDFKNGELSKNSITAINAALSIGETDILITEGENSRQCVDTYKDKINVNKIIFSSKINTLNYLNGELTGLVKQINDKYNYTHIFGTSSPFGKYIIPSLYIPCKSTIMNDIVNIIEPYKIQKYNYTGNILNTFELNTQNSVLCTVKSFARNMIDNDNNVKPQIEDVSTFETTKNLLNVEYDTSQSEDKKIDLSNANIVVSGGKGFASKENFELVYKLAHVLNAAVGSTRAAVDLQIAPPHTQVGQTGTTVSPSLYIAVGISGAAQHLMGMRESKTIVAINNDEGARIWSVSHLGIQGDLNEIVPQLISRLSK